MLVFDSHGSYLIDDFLLYAQENKILPFLLPSHATHLLQLLDVGVFQPFKHQHQVCLHEAVEFGDIEFSKLEFLHAFKRMRKSTFKSLTIISLQRKTGLFLFNPKVILLKMRILDKEREDQLVTPPPNKVLQPFMNTPMTRNRPAHRAYLEDRLCDYYSDIGSLTPSFYRSQRRFMKVTKDKIMEGLLIKDREKQRINAKKERLHQKSSSGKHVQKFSVLYVGATRRQIKWRTEEVKNGVMERAIKKGEQQMRRISKEIPKVKFIWQKERDLIISYFITHVQPLLLRSQIFTFQCHTINLRRENARFGEERSFR